MGFADTGEVQLSFQRSGSGPPLLLIMGMSGTFAHWDESFLQRLRADFEVIVYDHRGVGESGPLGEEPLTIARLAQDTAGLLAALQVDSAHVLGISMGGMVAQELALAHPERIRTLALGCTYCGGAGSSLASPEVAQRLLQGMSSGDRAVALRTAWEVNLSPDFAAKQEAFEVFRALRAVPVPVIMAQMQACLAHDTSTRLHALEIPTLIVHGTADQMIPVHNAHLIHGYIPDSRLEILDGIGHLFFWELPDRSAELLREHAAVPA
jgi:3-oxoadipate enol-lactonase